MRRFYILIILIATFVSNNSLYAQCDITVSDPMPCAMAPVTLSVVSPSGSYAWDLDNDGFIDVFGTSVVYNFPESNIDLNYTVVLYQNGVQCNTVDVFVLGIPDPTIGIVPGSGILEGNLIRVCSGSPDITLEVYNSSSTYSTNDTYEIDWGDGVIETYDNTTFSNTSTITHDYSAFGYFNITITVTGVNGCTNVEFYTLYNGGNPSVGLANPGNTVGLCAPAVVDFPITNTGNNPTGTIYTIFINGEVVALYSQETLPAVFSYLFEETSCGQATSTGNYQNAYDVQILASNPCGSTQATIEPIEVSSPPEVLFVSDDPSASCEGQSYTFTNSSGNLGEVLAGVCTSLAPSWTITPGTPGVDWEIISGNTFGSDEIEIVFYTPGEYTITMTINSPSCGAGSYSGQIEVFESPDAEAEGGLVTASVPANSDDCSPSYGIFTNGSIGDSLSYQWTITPGSGWEYVDTFDQNSEDLQILFTEPGEYMVSMNAFNFCADDTWDTLLVVADVPEVIINPIPNQCGEATFDFDPSMVAIDANFGILSSVQWSFPGAVPSSSTQTYPTNIYYANPGTYTVDVTITNQCGTHTASQTFEIEPIGTVSISPDEEVCEDASSFVVSGTPTGGDWSGPGVTSGGTFNPALANIGDNVLVYSVQEGACTLMDSLTVTVNPLPTVDAGPDQEACVDASAFPLSGGTPAGGTWSVDNGGVINGFNEFDPGASGAGVYNLTYVFTDLNGCTNFDTKVIEIHDLPLVNAGPDQSLCENPFDVELTSGQPAGGDWSGPGVNPDNTFNAANAGQGTHVLTYDYTDPVTGCFNSDEMEITVIPNEAAEAGPDESICDNEPAFVLNTGTPSGGYWTGPGVDSTTNIFYPAVAGLGTHVLTYFAGVGVCQTNDTKTITVLEAPTLIMPSEQLLCINDPSYDLSAATPTGGTWTGAGISGNSFIPADAGVGTHSITYSYTDGVNGCESSETIEMEVVPLPEIFVNDTTYCNTPGVVSLPIASPAGGQWSGQGVVGNAFDPVAAGGAGNYTIEYSYSDFNNCENTEPVVITVIEPANINAGNDFEVCIDGQTIDLSQIATPAGGTWNSNGSSGLNGTLFTPGVAGVGTHTLTYTIGEGNCQVTDNIEIIINPLPVVTTMDDFDICVSETSVDLFGSPAGGDWVAQNNGVIVGNSFNPNASGEGIFEITYTYTDINGCSNSDDLYITVNGLPVLYTNDTIFCNTPGAVSMPYATPAGGIWSGPGVGNNLFDPQGAGGPGTYNVTYSYTDANGCENTSNSTITVVPPANIDAGPDETICIDDLPMTLSNNTPANGIWSGTGITDPDNGIFDPSIAGAGVHTLTYAYGEGNCYVEDTKTVEVIDLIVDAGIDETSCFTYNEYSLDGYSPIGGEWAGQGIVDAQNGTFDPATAGVGVHVLTYTYTHPIFGCVRTDTKTIEVYPMEEADFNLPALACRNEPVQFENLSSTDYSMLWSFGEGEGTSTETHPTYSYDIPGEYTVSLEVENQYGCLDTISYPILIADVPSAYFETDTTEGCVGYGFDFINESFGDSLTYIWEFGDFQISNEENPGTIYFDQGNFDTTYVISLTATNICGTSTYQDVIIIHPTPDADFGIAPQTDCSPLIVEFANTTTGSASEYFWDFGNGNTSSEQFPDAQTYFTDSTFSIYDVTLIAYNICGTDTATTEVLVESANVTAVAEASIEAGCAPLTVDFYNYSTPLALIDWDFGDGNTSSQSEPTHTFEEPGEYTVIHYANSDCGYDTTALVITVYPQPEVHFEHPEHICSGQQVDFINNSINTSGNFWDFGDGNTSTLNNPSHTYDTPGTYTITLTGVSMFNQCEATYTSTITVLELPEAIFEPSTTYGCAPLDVQFVNHSTGALFYQWTFGDGNTSIDEEPTHTYEEPGTYEVTLLATDGNGCYEDYTIFNIIVRPKPEAEFDYEKEEQCGLPATINFENMSIGGLDFIWDFGEGSSSPFTSPSHTYTEAGIYEVTLTASNQFDCEDTFTLEIEIFDAPSASVEIESMDGCEPLEVTFNNTSSHSNNYFWDFGDGHTSTSSDPVHLYTSAGSYEVTLIANINEACSDTFLLSDVVEVYPTPFANFEAFEISDDGTYELTNLSQNADEFYWEFSDAASSTEVNPVHRFLNNGVHQIYLEATNEHGCVDDTLVSFIPDFVKGLYLPNAFSPEQGIGDVRLFKPTGIGIKEYHVRVFSTYGQLLWESKELDDQGRPTESWDGIVDGRMMPQDVYVWRCSAIFQDGSVWRGERDKDGSYKTIGSLVLLR